MTLCVDEECLKRILNLFHLEIIDNAAAWSIQHF